MGGSDSLGEAEDFAATYGGPPDLLWSDSYVAWNHYNAGNPILILLDGAGVTQVERVSGFSQSRIEDALDGLT